MSTEMIGIARFKFHPGKVEEFKRLSEQAFEIVRTKDPGTLEYSIYFNADESEAIVIERYTDAQAGMQHIANIGDELMAAVMATADVYGELLGDAPPELRDNLEGSPVQLFTPYKSL